MNDWLVGAMCTLSLAVATVLGWIYAHETVATECKKLGAFYVSSNVYECKLKEQP